MVPVELDGFNISSLSGDNAWVISDEAATDCDLCSFGFFFLWANGANNSGKGDFSAFGNLMLVDEEDCVGSFDSVANSLCKISEFICG